MSKSKNALDPIFQKGDRRHVTSTDVLAISRYAEATVGLVADQAHVLDCDHPNANDHSLFCTNCGAVINVNDATVMLTKAHGAGFAIQQVMLGTMTANLQRMHRMVAA